MNTIVQSAVIENTNNSNPVSFIDVQTLATRLGVPKKTIYKWTSEKSINDFPYYKVGKHCKFIWEEVIAWVRLYGGSVGTQKNLSPKCPR